MEIEEIKNFEKIIKLELDKQFYIIMGLFGFLVAAFANEWKVSSIFCICSIIFFILSLVNDYKISKLRGKK